jgi:hypothetical protein
MKLLITATGSYLTGDDIADAVLQYWRVLSEDHAADVVDIPFLDEQGRSVPVQLAIGWGLPLAAVGSDSPSVLEDHALVKALRARRLDGDGGSFFLAEEIGHFDHVGVIV